MDNVLIIFAMIVNVFAIIHLVFSPVMKIERDIKLYLIFLWCLGMVLSTSTIYFGLKIEDLKKTMNNHGLYEVVVPIESTVKHEVRWEFKDKNSVSEVVK